MKKYFSLLLIVIVSTSYSQTTSIDCSKLKPIDPYFYKTKDTVSTFGPVSITRNILQDKKGNMWFASWQGIMKFDGKEFTNYTLKENLIQFHMFALLEDSKGNIWFGSIRGGVYLYDGKTFTLFTTAEGLASNLVGCIYEDKNGNIWFGTDMGVSCYTSATLSASNPNAPSPGATAGLTTLAGVMIKSKKSFTNYTTKDGLSNNDVNAIIEDNTGKLWFGTRGDGVCYYEDNSFHSFKNNEGLAFNQVRAIIKDKKGNLWFGGNDGLWRYNPSASLGTGEKVFTNYTTKFVGYIYEDKKGNIWTGSEGEGPRNWVLTRYNEKGEPTIIKKQAGQIFGILEDKDGKMWIGTENGVCLFDPEKIVADDKAFTEFRTYILKKNL